ncbi:uncharacterized protein C8R40DRAFT_1071958 [Lentinula edodes]|uniref:uncharacterized protein n=1 Tax=Lentinula edodes TaxID=5353 RepID=UPI001E8EE888|nr:uncharacterized protein C8R40DRAFT_1071958 [Lentinula edodes]KAH7872184.1 hypothetical protein C8R40DRAFT_1071958 [Lentinula edodes]
MTRRPTYRLRKLYTRQRLRIISPSDGRGWLYAYLDGGVEWKIGMSKDLVRRRHDWEKRCLCRNRKWFPPVPVANRRRAGYRVHIEKFTFTGHWRLVWREIVKPALQRAATI